MAHTAADLLIEGLVAWGIESSGPGALDSIDGCLQPDPSHARLGRELKRQDGARYASVLE